jgi:hypothetical protein
LRISLIRVSESGISITCSRNYTSGHIHYLCSTGCWRDLPFLATQVYAAALIDGTILDRRPTMIDSAAEIHSSTASIANLASHRHCVERLQTAWPAFLAKRAQRLEQQRRLGEACEKVAENILEDLFTSVLDWPLSDLNNQLKYADIVLTSLGIKHLLVEVKRPGSLAWNRRAVNSALDQAKRYADEQKVKTVAISDGEMLYAANIADGGLRDRIFVSLGTTEPPCDLWWLSVQGIWREVDLADRAQIHLLPEGPVLHAAFAETIGNPQILLHPKYHLPAYCFAYAGDHSKPHSWKLPYLLADGTVDAKRLPKAVQAILSNYRGAKVSGIPEQAIKAVLARLAKAARQIGHMPPEACNPAPIYRQLAEALEQLGAVEFISAEET